MVVQNLQESREFQRLVVHTVTNKRETPKEIGSQIKMSALVWSIRITIKMTGIFKYVKPSRFLRLTSAHKNGRLQFVEKHLKQLKN